MSIRYYSTAEMARVLWHCEAHPTPENLILELMMITGARGAEIAKLTRQDFNMAECTVHIRASKRSNNRTLKLPRAFLLRLSEHVLLKLGTTARVVSLISTSGQVRSITRQLRRLWPRLRRQVFGADDARSLHKLRHTYIMQAMETCEDNILDVQLLAGHKSLNSTARYLQAKDQSVIANMVCRRLEAICSGAVIQPPFDDDDIENSG